MGLRDQFKSTPEWKHKDAAVRIAALEKMDDGQQEEIATLAREDHDPKVRLAAVRRLTDPGLLGELGRSEVDGGVRRGVLERLVELATRGSDGDRATEALAALSEPRDLGAVAKGAVRDDVCLAALERLADTKALISVARHAGSQAVRMAALERLAEPAERGQVAIKSDHDDVARAALESIDDRGVLKSIALRARDRDIAVRAREILATLEVESSPPDPEVIEAERREVCRSLEFLFHSDNWSRVPERIVAAEQRWQELGGVVDEELTRRFDSACEELRRLVREHERQRAEDQIRRETIEREVAARLELCDAVDSMQGPDALERLQEARASWDALAPVSHAKAETLERRFEEACRRCQQRHADWRAAHAARARREELCQEAEDILASTEGSASKERWAALRAAWREIPAGGERQAELEERFNQALARHAEISRAIREEGVGRRRENLKRLRDLCTSLRERLKSEDLTLRDAGGNLTEIRAALENPGPLPSKRDEERVVEKLKTLRAAYGSRVQELRETVEWQRWANAGVQEELCDEAEALLESKDLDAVARQLRDLERRWRQARVVPRSQAQALWRRFEAARDTLRSRCEAHFARQKEERAKNLKEKEAICERAEALADSTEWIKTTEEFKKLQQEWQAIGPVPRQQAKAIWARFRAPCDRFFTRRREDLKGQKEEWARNLERKKALCEQAEALAESIDWEKTAAEVRKLQAEWKKVGPVRKSQSEALWRRFRRGCDRFYERYRRRDEVDAEIRIAARESLCRELEALLPGDAEETPELPDDLVERVLAICRRWQGAGAVPRPKLEPLSERFSRAVHRLVLMAPQRFAGTELDLQATRKGMEELCARVEGLLASSGSGTPEGASPGAILAAQLREALAANTIGGVSREEARWRAAAPEVERAQEAWKRLGPLPGEDGEALTRRFQAACRKFYARRPPGAQRGS